MRFPSEKAFIDRKLRSDRRKRVYRAKKSLAKRKTVFPSYNRVKAWLVKAKTPLQNENFARKGENAFTERKRRSQRRKRFLPSENVPPIGEIASTVRKYLPQSRKRVYRTKTGLAKKKTLLSGEYDPRKMKTSPYTLLTCYNIVRKRENAFIERKRVSQSRNCYF